MKEECKNCSGWNDYRGQCMGIGMYCPTREQVAKEATQEQQKENTTELIKLIKENPDLPILPMVSYEVVAGDEFAYWGGSWGEARIDSYFVNDERVVYKSEDEPEIVVEKTVGYERFNEMTDEEVKEAWEKLPWIKAIIVKIETP
jgi:hypothetical protein